MPSVRLLSAAPTGERLYNSTRLQPGSVASAAKSPACVARVDCWDNRWCGYTSRWRIHEVDPLVCPHCGAEMRIVAFILDHEVIDTILRHLASKEAERNRAPPGCPDGEDASQ